MCPSSHCKPQRAFFQSWNPHCVKKCDCISLTGTNVSSNQVQNCSNRGTNPMLCADIPWKNLLCEHTLRPPSHSFVQLSFFFRLKFMQLTFFICTKHNFNMHLLAFFMSYREPSWKNTIPRACRFLRGSISYSHRCIITSVALQGSVPGAGYVSYLSWSKGLFSPETHLTFHFACVSSLLRWLNKIRKILLHPPVWLLVPPSRACRVLIKMARTD